MSSAILRFQFRAHRLVWLLVVGVVLALALLKTEPLRPQIRLYASGRSFMEPILIVMYFVGLIVGWRVHSERSGESVWLGSRGLTRRQEYLSRCGTDLLVIASCVAVVAILIVTGLRQGVQQALDSPWYPMVRWLELRCLPAMALYAILPFGLVSLMLGCVRTDAWMASALGSILAMLAASALSWLAFVITAREGAEFGWVLWLIASVCLVLSTCLHSVSEEYAS